MKRMISICLLLFAGVATWAQDVITYQFQKGETFVFNNKTTDSKGNTTTAKVSMSVQDVEGGIAKIEFLTTDIQSSKFTSAEQQEMIQEIMEKVKRSSRTVIQFEPGKPIKILNIEEIRAAVPELMNELIDVFKKDPKLAETAEQLKGIIDFMVPMMQEAITEDTQVEQIKFYILNYIPRTLGESKTKTDEGADVVTVLKATNAQGEFEINQTTSMKYDKESLKKLVEKKKAEASSDNDSASSELTEGILALLEGMEMYADTKGVIYQNGTPKDIIIKADVKMSAMGQTESGTTTIEITRVK